MKKQLFIAIALCIMACNDSITKKEYKSPETRWGQLFIDVVSQEIFETPKIFADAVPKFTEKEILEKYELEKKSKGFNLKTFVSQNFIIGSKSETFKGATLTDYLSNFYIQNIQKPTDDGGSLIPTRKEYLGGGEGFKENSYFNSYFVMQGLTKNDSLLSYAVLNCAQFIQDYGHVPAGNRSYMINRSNPPMLSLMVEHLAEKKGDTKIYLQMLPLLTKEYQYWMSAENSDEVSKQNSAKSSGFYHKVVFMPNENILNRYYVGLQTPRVENYIGDINLAKNHKIPKAVFQNLQTESESNWADGQRWKDCLGTLPVDLNALLYHYEITLAKAYRLKNQADYAASFEALAKKRKAIFDQYFWNEAEGYYFDYNYQTKTQNSKKTMAGILPLLVGMANPAQAKKIETVLRKDFLKSIGLVNPGSEFTASAQMHFLAVLALQKAGFKDLAQEIKSRWVKTNQSYFVKHKEIAEFYSAAAPLVKQKNMRKDAAVGVMRMFLRE